MKTLIPILGISVGILFLALSVLTSGSFTGSIVKALYLVGGSAFIFAFAGKFKK